MTGGRLRRIWNRERQQWQRPMAWKFFAFTAVLAVAQGWLAVGRGDQWFVLLASILAGTSALLAVFAFRESHRR